MLELKPSKYISPFSCKPKSEKKCSARPHSQSNSKKYSVFSLMYNYFIFNLIFSFIAPPDQNSMAVAKLFIATGFTLIIFFIREDKKKVAEPLISSNPPPP